MAPDLSLCVVTDSGPVLPLLRTLHETADPVSFEAIVVELSAGGGGERILAEFPETKLFANATSLSYAKDRNLALRLAAGRYVALVDRDVVLRPGCLQRLVDFMDENPEVGIAGPKVIDGYGRPEPSARTLPDLPILLAHYSPLSGQLHLPNLEKKHRLDGWEHHTTREVELLVGGCHCFRRDLLDEIGFLDESFQTPLAELEYYLRARQAGWHQYFVHEAEILHLNPGRYHPQLAAGKGRVWPCFQDILCYLLKKWFPAHPIKPEP